MASLIESRAFEVWEAHGLKCAMAPSPMGTPNGYVQVPEDLRLYDYEDVAFSEIEVHGGLTYGVDEDGWVGFDALHSGDIWPIEIINRFSERGEIAEGSLLDPCSVDRKYRSKAYGEWSIERMRREVESLAEQLSKHTLLRARS